MSVADTTGELRRLTQLADVVFVGKSLAPHTEGQTPVEAASLGRPILFGPGMGNFRQLAAELVAASKKTVGEADEALRLANARYHAGTATQLDVLTSQVSLTQARTNELQASYTYLTAAAAMRKAVGQSDALVNN